MKIKIDFFSLSAEFSGSGCIDCCVNPQTSFLGVQGGLVLIWLYFMDVRCQKKLPCSSAILAPPFALIVIISFLLLVLGFVGCFFPSSFQCERKLFIWDFPCFLRYTCIAINFSLSTAFAEYQIFWTLCFHFHLFPCTV